MPRTSFKSSSESVAKSAVATVRLEKLKSGSWTLVRNLPVSASGTFHTKVRGKAPGFKSYRIVRSATSANVSATATLPRLDVYRLHEHGLWATMQQDD